MFTPRPDPYRAADHVLPVSVLNRLVREALEQRFPLLMVGGEISNLTRAASGHCYFSLKDETAQVRCVMFRNRSALLPFQLQNGMQVEARALVTFYEPRGDFQLNIDSLRRAGVGSLHEAFIRLRDKLGAEGLFEPARKRALPVLPRRIGILTSLAAAALRDVLTALERRAPHVPVIIYPIPVQGEGASTLITRQLLTAGQRSECDVLILTRGGGSIEDLWAFNDEALARAVAQTHIPVITGIGHETDFTIADFAADLRAATPTAAAELVSAGHMSAAREVETQQQHLQRAIHRKLEKAAQTLDFSAGRLQHPKNKIEVAKLRSDALRDRLSRNLHGESLARREKLNKVKSRLLSQRPDTTLLHFQLSSLKKSLSTAIGGTLARQRTTASALATHLEHLAPQAILRRGYSIVRDKNGHIVKDAAQLTKGETVEIQLGQGEVRATVE